jgi:capsular exopolysaccharide synthesis family protein
MGKIHDALEKSGQSEKVTTAASPASSNKVAKPRKATRPPIKKIKVVSSQKETKKSLRKAGVLDPALVTFHDPSSVEAEIFKILRTNILFPKVGTPPRSIMVTSAIPSDGKSFVAANLAISIAQGVEEYVLLMDCDMRRSRVHSQFGFKSGIPGLSNYLSNQTPLASLLVKTEIDKLTILPGGPPPRNPSELLSSQPMKELLKETKARYKDRFVIVDSPPPHLTAETTALANYIDGIIIVVKYGSTPKDMVKDLLEKLGREKVLGVVMNGYRVPATERYGYGKYNRYKQYYG